MNTRSNTSLKHTWQAQIRQLATRNPKLAQALWQNRQVYFARFAHFYQQLANLPRKFRRKFLKRLATALAGVALLLALGQTLPIRAATITVDGVTCTLADAINAANTDTATGGCVAGGGVDVIDLQTDVELSAPLPFVMSELTIIGNGHILDGKNSFRVLNVQPTGNLTLNDAIVMGGNAVTSGGGILNVRGILTVNNSTISENLAFDYGGGLHNNGGTLMVNNSTISNNVAEYGFGGGIYNGLLGTVIVNNSTISNNIASYNGGGFYNSSGTTEVNNSTISGNSANNGGGIQNKGALTLNYSLVSGNDALNGGGIYNGGSMIVENSTLNNNSAYEGDGIYNFDSGTLTVNNTTLSDNSASYGGGIDNDGETIVNNSTLSGNFGAGGGISNDGLLTVNNSTLTGNSGLYGNGILNFGTLNLNRNLISGNSSDEVYNFGSINANNFNVIGYSHNPFTTGFNPGPNDIIPIGPLATVLDLTLTGNGGPTLTHALVSGSVAMDIAPNGDCTAPPINGLDQRGFPRNVDGNGASSNNECDAGAFEFASNSTLTPTATGSPSPTATSTPTNVPETTRTPRPTVTATQRSTSTPTRFPTATPRNSPTPTRTPLPALSIILNLESVPSASAPSQAANPLLHWFVVTLQTLGIWFRNRKV